MDKKHDEIIQSPDGFKMTDTIVGVRDNGDGSFSDFRWSAAQILAFVNGTTFVGATVLETPVVGDGQVTLTGSDVSGADYYQIQISTNSNFTGAASVNTVSWPKVITSLTNGTTYYFRARVFIGPASGDWSNTVSGVPQALPQLDPPTISVVAGDSKLTVTVGAIPGASAQQIQISSDNFATIANASSGANDGNPVDISATNGTVYKVRAKVSGAGYTDSNYAVASGTYTPVAVTTYTATVGHSATDPFVDTSTAPSFTTLRSVTPANGSNIVVQLNDFPFEYFVLEYDDSQPDVTSFFDTIFHGEAIPGFEFRGPFAVGGKKYVTSYNPTAFDASSATVTFSF